MPGSRLDGVTPLSAHGVMACPSSSAAAVLSQPKCALGAEAVQHSHTRCKMGEKLVVSVSFKEWAAFFFFCFSFKKERRIYYKYIQLCLGAKNGCFELNSSLDSKLHKY